MTFRFDLPPKKPEELKDRTTQSINEELRQRNEQLESFTGEEDNLKEMTQSRIEELGQELKTREDRKFETEKERMFSESISRIEQELKITTDEEKRDELTKTLEELKNK
ncbi:MAG: hypothetical protein QG654_568 [Patescibacteria group bacterium]|nr:hypothetical protein [Patescibacteria group bacterium]